MIYDPRRRALELRQRIIESMTAEELEEYAKSFEAKTEEPNEGSRNEVAGPDTAKPE